VSEDAKSPPTSCPGCGAETAPTDRFCRDCGAALPDGGVPARSVTVDDLYAEYRQRSSDQPRDADAHYNLGLACLYQRRYREAVTHFEAVIQLLPSDPAGYEKCAVALCQLGEHDRALDVARAGLAAAPGTPVLRRIESRLAPG